MVHCILKTALFESPAEPGKLKLTLTLESNSKPSDVHERLSIDLMAPEVDLRRHQQSVVTLLDLLAPVTHVPRKEGAISQSPLYPYSSGQLFLR